MSRTARIVAVLVVTLSLSLVSPLVPVTRADATQTYLVLYKGNAVPSDAAATIAQAGGTLVYAYGAIGVAVARSGDANFRQNLLRDNRVEGAGATGGLGVGLSDDVMDANGPPAGPLPNS